MPAGIETFGNSPSATVTSGGTTTGSTSFNITPAGGSSWPAASSAVTPNTFFRITDPAVPSEIMVVTTAAGGAGADTWTVLRGQEGTTAAAHAANWTAVQVISAGTFQNLKQASNAAVAAVTVSSTTETVVATYTPVAVDIEAGASFEAVAFGTMQRLGGAAPGQITWKLKWGSTAVATLVTGTNSPTLLLTTIAAGTSWDCNGTLVLLDTTHAVANLNFWFNTPGTPATINTGLVSTGSVVISGSGPLTLTATIGGTIGTSEQIVAAAPLIYRAA